MLNYSVGASAPTQGQTLPSGLAGESYTSSFLPMISKRGSSQRQVVSGKGVDDLYSYYNKEML